MMGRILWAAIGLLMMIGGVAALANPLAATLTAEQIAAWTFLLAGLLQLFAVVRDREWPNRLWALLLGVACLWLGISLLLNPLESVIALTFVVALGFLVSGIAKLVFALRIRGNPYFLPTVLSGLLSVGLALMVFFNFPQSAAVLLGVLLAVELLGSGATIVVFALLLRKTLPA